ncbi:MAG: nucleotidyltransferase [Bdellovibrionota bacterium]
MKDLNSLLKILTDSGIDFVLVGGYAATVYGSALITQDLDICAVITKENVDKLRTCLRNYHPTHRMIPNRISFLTHPSDVTGWNNLYLETDLGTVDVLNQITGVGDYEKVAKNAIELKIFGQKCKVISIDDLILAKQAMGRPKDLHTIKELEVIRAKTKK